MGMGDGTMNVLNRSALGIGDCIARGLRGACREMPDVVSLLTPHLSLRSAGDWPRRRRSGSRARFKPAVAVRFDTLGRGERLALDGVQDAPAEKGLKARAQASERAAIQTALAEQDFSMTATAARLGISRKTLWQKMKRYGVTRPE